MTASRGIRRPRTLTIEEARHLLFCGESIVQVAAILGVELDTLAKAATMLGASDVNEAISAYRVGAAELLRAA